MVFCYKKRKILNLIFSNFILAEKNVEISMRKAYNLLSEIGGCIEWWWNIDELLTEIISYYEEFQYQLKEFI